MTVMVRKSPFKYPLRFLMQKGIIGVALSGLLSCTPETSPSLKRFLEEPQLSAPPKYLDCADLVNRHVLATRSWDESLFNVSFDGINLQYDAPRFRVTHIDDLRDYDGFERIGSGTSFFVVVDCTNMKIINELKMQ